MFLNKFEHVWTSFDKTNNQDTQVPPIIGDYPTRQLRQTRPVAISRVLQNGAQLSGVLNGVPNLRTITRTAFNNFLWERMVNGAQIFGERFEERPFVNEVIKAQKFDTIEKLIVTWLMQFCLMKQWENWKINQVTSLIPFWLLGYHIDILLH